MTAGRPTHPLLPRALCRAALALAAAACASGPAATSPSAAAPSAPPPGWTLSWSDEFAGPSGAAVDAAKWVADTGGQGWGNREREYYTAGTGNAALDGDGHLAITARAEPATTALRCWYGPCRYTSARLLTKGRFTQAYGRFEARIRIPRGQGIWPAFWTLGADIDRVGWPRCGEIDVMENIGREPGITHGTIHGPGLDASGVGGADTLPAGRAWADDFHVYAAEWEPAEIRFYADGRQYRRIARAELPAGAEWVYDRPHFLLLNLAVGGAWPGDPDGSTTTPQRMLVDWVRVWRR